MAYILYVVLLISFTYRESIKQSTYFHLYSTHDVILALKRIKDMMMTKQRWGVLVCMCTNS